MKFEPVVQEEMSFKEKVYGRTDARWTKTDHNSSPKNKISKMRQIFLDPRMNKTPVFNYFLRNCNAIMIDCLFLEITYLTLHQLSITSGVLPFFDNFYRIIVV